MPLINITTDEHYPFYDWVEQWESSEKIDVPRETINRWTLAMMAFFQVQSEMAYLCGDMDWQTELMDEATRFVIHCSRCGGQITEDDGSGKCRSCVDELASRPWVSVMDPRTRAEYLRDHPSGEV